MSNSATQQDYTEHLLDGAEYARGFIEIEFALAGLKLDNFWWNVAQGKGIYVNFPYQLFSVSIGNWTSEAELIDSDLLLELAKGNQRSTSILLPKIQRLLKNYVDNRKLTESKDYMYSGR